MKPNHGHLSFLLSPQLTGQCCLNRTSPLHVPACSHTKWSGLPTESYRVSLSYFKLSSQGKCITTHPPAKVTDLSLLFLLHLITLAQTTHYFKIWPPLTSGHGMYPCGSSHTRQLRKEFSDRAAHSCFHPLTS